MIHICIYIYVYIHICIYTRASPSKYNIRAFFRGSRRAGAERGGEKVVGGCVVKCVGGCGGVYLGKGAGGKENGIPRQGWSTWKSAL